MAKNTKTDSSMAEGAALSAASAGAEPEPVKRRFSAAFDILQGADAVPAGGHLTLTYEEHAELRAVGAVTDPWLAGQPTD